MTLYPLWGVAKKCQRFQKLKNSFLVGDLRLSDTKKASKYLLTFLRSYENMLKKAIIANSVKIL